MKKQILISLVSKIGTLMFQMQSKASSILFLDFQDTFQFQNEQFISVGTYLLAETLSRPIPSVFVLSIELFANQYFQKIQTVTKQGVFATSKSFFFKTRASEASTIGPRTNLQTFKKITKNVNGFDLCIAGLLDRLKISNKSFKVFLNWECHLGTTLQVGILPSKTPT